MGEGTGVGEGRCGGGDGMWGRGRVWGEGGCGGGKPPSPGVNGVAWPIASPPSRSPALGPEGLHPAPHWADCPEAGYVEARLRLHPLLYRAQSPLPLLQPRPR